MKNVKKWLVIGTISLSTLAFAACSNNKSSESQSKPISMPTTYSATGKASKADDDSTLNAAEVVDAPFTGITLAVLQDNVEDSDVYSPGGGDQLFKSNKDFKIVKGGLANLKLDRSNNTATITIRKNAKWSNGSPVIAKDVEYAYEIIGNQNTGAEQYSSDMATIKGMAAYHTGKAKQISGITYPDGQNGKQVVIHYTHLSPAMQYAGNSFLWGTVVPYQHIKNVKISKLSSSPAVRKHPIFVGPYKLQNQVQGESTAWVPNKYYWGPQPKIKHVNIQVVSSSNAAAAFKAKKFDFALGGLPASQYKSVKNIKGYTLAGAPGLSYGYFGFNVGHFDTKTNKNVMDKHSKMGNKNLRKAMLYAVDLDKVNKKLLSGVQWRPNTLIPPIFKKYHDNKAAGFPYDMAKAKKLLKDAGYKKKGKWYVQPNGKKLTIHFGAMQGSAASNEISRYEVQQWRKLGLNVQMTNGRPLEINSFYSILGKPKQKQIDVFVGGWQLTYEPTPTQFYGEDATYNMGHFVTKKNTKLLNSLNSNKAWNQQYRIKQFKKWQVYMNKEAAYAPQSTLLSFTPVNHRLKNFKQAAYNNYLFPTFWDQLELTSKTPK
ncbi:ABC transporter substrate-binding protein [Lentilactobacillus buchneri]|uniref:Solute-binding protein family 5 domain-containing protein n=1 Tax=Lentilactobacillus buchneri DSM 20057 TaxID=1423728 RepID=A0A4V6PJP7_LENBU|nr:ABC transporter substrate-binding protein [Lentilactobacillus buchneri]KRK68513.1 ABC transporter periplasmic protein [Lentilactobacillus buchneri DSM 20057]MCT2881590.1 oligopeptide ABC transporter substrate-binding protein [Lentilactobacillus buchneri]MCT2898050.1 oligopeptide ABC transporter substrate-binding protein [Lentilactobacillus buchneri]MCT3252945.1 oligopeptide ABC transporter substrate-binding protein [Lentilactobacillus buchneri]MCT3547539.1 oligopeptide ABC transporter subst